MANPLHLALLSEGTETWNSWIHSHTEVAADFSEAELGGANISRANIRKANLSGAYLSKTLVVGASFRDALIINSSNLSKANLYEANLSKADLSTTVALRWRDAALKPVWEQSWLEGSARRGVGLKRGSHVFQASNRQMHGLAQPISVVLPIDASIGHPTGAAFGA